MVFALRVWPLRVLVRSDARQAARRSRAVRRSFDEARQLAMRRQQGKLGSGVTNRSMYLIGVALPARTAARHASVRQPRRADYDGTAGPLSSSAGHLRSVDFLLDALLMGECDGYVGKFSSSLGRLAYSLMATRNGVDCLRPCELVRPSSGPE